jgi:hypothetical protein
MEVGKVLDWSGAETAQALLVRCRLRKFDEERDDSDLAIASGFVKLSPPSDNLIS